MTLWPKPSQCVQHSTTSFANSWWGKGGKKGGRRREDYLWGQHRIKDEQGSSRDFAKNHYNDYDEDDDVKTSTVIAAIMGWLFNV